MKRLSKYANFLLICVLCFGMLPATSSMAAPAESPSQSVAAAGINTALPSNALPALTSSNILAASGCKTVSHELSLSNGFVGTAGKFFLTVKFCYNNTGNKTITIAKSDHSQRCEVYWPLFSCKTSNTSDFTVVPTMKGKILQYVTVTATSSFKFCLGKVCSNRYPYLKLYLYPSGTVEKGGGG
jgi:hypothetical protein